MLYILLAAYNEEHDLPHVLEAISDQNWRWEHKVVLVNDGSTDNTRQVSEKYSQKLNILRVDHKQNQGLGRALSTGFREINKTLTENDIIVTMDADGTHPVETVCILKQKVEAGCDVVIASRFCEGGKQAGVPFFRMFLSKAASLIMKFISPIRGVKDYTSGYRAFSGKLIKKLVSANNDSFITEKGFPATLEILLKSKKLTNNYAEVPLFLHYDRKTGLSKMKILRTLVRYFVLIVKSLFSKKGADNQIKH